MPNNIPRNKPFYSFVLSWIISVTLFINKRDSSRDLTIFLISFIYSLKFVNVVITDPNIFLWIAASVADAGTFNANGIKTLLGNGLSANHFLEMVLKDS